MGEKNAGDTFGELSLLYGKPRAATVVVDQPSVCIVARKHDYDTLVRPWHEKEEQEISKFLGQVSVVRASLEQQQLPRHFQPK